MSEDALVEGGAPRGHGARNRYVRIIEHVFLSHYHEGERAVDFARDELEAAATAEGIALPKNVGDILYTFRYRGAMPAAIANATPAGHAWVIIGRGKSMYRLLLIADRPLTPRSEMVETNVPDSTPGLIAKYALSDEQALLAKLRYNRLIDIFTGITCYSLQNHLRTQVPGIGQTETDEVYVGIDRRGAQYVLPIQAKGGKDRQSIVQIIQDIGMCSVKFPQLICRPISAQFMRQDVIAMFEYEASDDGARVLSEKHYKLLPWKELRDEDIWRYRERFDDHPAE